MRRYPQIKVKLIGEDSNAFHIMAKVRRALKDGGVPSNELNQFMEEAMDGDYNQLLITVQNWVTVK